jgi:hypothetical protein
MSLRKSWAWLAVIDALISTGLGGCYHYRVSAPQVSDLSAVPVTETKWSLAWGLVQEEASDTSCACMNNGLKEITSSTNLGYALLSVVTLGIVVPMDVEYVCGKPPAGGPYPDPPSGCPNVVDLPVPEPVTPLTPDAGIVHDPDDGEF